MATQFYLIPSWFFGFGFALEVLFGIITLSVALYSFKVYRLCMQRECKLFGWSFLALAFSYFSWAFVSWYVPARLSAREGVISLTGFTTLVTLGVYAHVLLFLLGLVTLTYLTLGIKSQRTYTLLVSVVLIVLIFSSHKIIAFYFVSSLLLFYILIYYGLQYWHGRHNFLVVIAFVFLFFGTLDFTLSAINDIHYVVGHMLYLVGYLFILANFILMARPLRKRKRWKKH